MGITLVWKLIANIIKAKLVKIYESEDMIGETQYLKGEKDALFTLITQIAELYDHEGVVVMKEFIKASVPENKKVPA